MTALCPSARRSPSAAATRFGELRDVVGWRAYLGDGELGPRRDVEKLSRFPKDEGAWVMFLATANPGREDWDRSIERFNAKFGPLRLRAVTDPAEFPDEYFLGLAEVVRG